MPDEDTEPGRQSISVSGSEREMTGLRSHSLHRLSVPLSHSHLPSAPVGRYSNVHWDKKSRLVKTPLGSSRKQK